MQISVRVDAVQLGRPDERVHRSRAFAAGAAASPPRIPPKLASSLRLTIAAITAPKASGVSRAPGPTLQPCVADGRGRAAGAVREPRLVEADGGLAFLAGEGAFGRSSLPVRQQARAGRADLLADRNLCQHQRHAAGDQRQHQGAVGHRGDADGGTGGLGVSCDRSVKVSSGFSNPASGASWPSSRRSDVTVRVGWIAPVCLHFVASSIEVDPPSWTPHSYGKRASKASTGQAR